MNLLACLLALLLFNPASLESGDIPISSKIEHGHMFVEAQIYIEAPPKKVWEIVINPEEFKGKIQKHLSQYNYIVNKPNDITLIYQIIDLGILLPKFKYTVQSIYHPYTRIDFIKTSGDFKDLEGYWLFEPYKTGTILTFAMYLDPGLPVPQWVIRQGLKGELPNTLKGIRDRVYQLQ